MMYSQGTDNTDTNDLSATPWAVRCVLLISTVWPVPDEVVRCVQDAFAIDAVDTRHSAAQGSTSDSSHWQEGKTQPPSGEEVREPSESRPGRRIIVRHVLDAARRSNAHVNGDQQERREPEPLRSDLCIVFAPDSEVTFAQLRAAAGGDSRAAWASPPLVVVTADGTDEQRTAALAADGAEDVLTLDALHVAYGGESDQSGANGGGRSTSDAALMLRRDLRRRLQLAVLRHHALQHEVGERVREARLVADRLESVLQASADPVVVVDRSGIIQFANTSASEFFQHPLANMIGAPFGQPIGSAPIQELDVVRRDGTHAVVELRVVPIEWEGESASLASLRDVTERKRTELDVRDYANQLGLSNKELKRFIYLVSEDLRSPLMTILGYASQMKRSVVASDAEKVAQYSDRIALASQRGLQHLGALLDYGRIAQGQDDLQPIDVSEVVRDIVNDLQAEDSDRRVSIDVEPSMPMLLAHREHIADLFRNLIENALRHGAVDTDDPRIWVGATKMDREVRYFVKDNGPGIPIHHQRRVFDLFEQFGPLNVGAGVGLAIVKRVANIYSGRAWVESKPNEGATFWIGIPTLE
ncbi:MAG: sensor histidine kinase [Planctomycetota bacterium]